MSPADTSKQGSTHLLLLCLIVLGEPMCSWVVGAAAPPPLTDTTALGFNTTLGNHSSSSSSCGGNTRCMEGVVLPVWLPENPPFPERLARAAIYFVGLMYMFVGVSIIADRFMASIEVITSQERRITVRKPNGEKVVATVRVWNETVSNLTLMALGSSAPEILLSVVEVCGHNFDAGELGPNTIVGSAAFNMFVIIGLCVSVIPEGQTRKVKHLRVFFVTASWSIFAYTWLYLILAVITPGVVEIWEGLLTLAFFPLCVGFAYVADRRLLFYKYVHKRYRKGKRKGVIVETEGEPELRSPKVGDGLEMLGLSADRKDDELAVQDGEVARILSQLRQEHPDKGPEQLLELANHQVLRSQVLYHCQATMDRMGMAPIVRNHQPPDLHQVCSEALPASDSFTTVVFFDPARYQCVESCGSVALTVVRRGADLDTTMTVDYRTEDGTAIAGPDYNFAEGSIVFQPGETEKEIRIHIVNDDIFEKEEHFLVHLKNVRVPEGRKTLDHHTATTILGFPRTATVTVIDDDHAGVFTFEEPVVNVSKSDGTMEVKVMRRDGARGAVALPYRTIEDTAKGGGQNFEDTHGILEFRDDELVKTIVINIIDDKQYDKNKKFFLEMGAPQLLEMSERKAVLLQEVGEFRKTERQLFGREVYRKLQGQNYVSSPAILRIKEADHQLLSKREEEERRVAQMGRPVLGEHVKLEVIIEESYEFKSAVDKILKKTNLALVIGTSSWREQFLEAITVSSGDDDDDDENGDAPEKTPSWLDYTCHFVTVFWKVLFALVPPTDYWSGWACFTVSMCVIGLLTAVIGDLASHFGCTIGLKDSVTAVVFVALGTSVPDTFASKVAAIQDHYADASIGNVTGSNAVNVFLGIGVAWSIAAIYHHSKGQKFLVDPGTLAFSVTLFTIFAFICIAVLLYRRRPEIGGELGGPRLPKMLTTCLFFSLWLMYIVFSSLEAYCHIEGF